MAVFGDALSALLQQIDPRHSVVVIGAPPEFPYSVPDEMIKRIRFGQPLEPLARSRHEARAARTASLLADIAFLNNVSLLDLTDVFCDATVCNMETDGVPLFADHVHLSAKGNAVLLETLASDEASAQAD